MTKNINARKAVLKRYARDVVIKHVKIGTRDFVRMSFGPFKSRKATQQVIDRMEKEAGLRAALAPSCGQ